MTRFSQKNLQGLRTSTLLICFGIAILAKQPDLTLGASLDMMKDEPSLSESLQTPYLLLTCTIKRSVGFACVLRREGREERGSYKYQPEVLWWNKGYCLTNQLFNPTKKPLERELKVSCPPIQTSCSPSGPTDKLCLACTVHQPV